jgi:hypothetical protein
MTEASAVRRKRAHKTIAIGKIISAPMRIGPAAQAKTVEKGSRSPSASFLRWGLFLLAQFPLKGVRIRPQ